MYRFLSHNQLKPTASRVTLPDPGVVNALGGRHSLQSAIADLVDNSIDAQASRVLVRFLFEGAVPVGLQVIDNGRGMTPGQLENAMVFGRTQSGTGRTLGHFGIGLKAASLSQANVMFVWTRSTDHIAAGCRLSRESLKSGPLIESYSEKDARAVLNDALLPFSLKSGTIVEWQEIRTFLTSANLGELSAWFSKTSEKISTYLGLVFHRFISDNRIVIEIDNLDLNSGETGLTRYVSAINPFGYPKSGCEDYPAQLPFQVGDQKGLATLYIWPAKSKDPNFTFGGEPTSKSQGFYIYRNDRLLQFGGWNNLVLEDPKYAQARVAVILTPGLEKHVTINAEKRGVVFDAEIKHALLMAANSDGVTLSSYLDKAKELADEAARRRPSAVKAPWPKSGLPSSVKRAFRMHTVPAEHEQVQIKWLRLPESEVFRIDDHILILNSRHRQALGGTAGGGILDAPVTKTLLLLLLKSQFEGRGSGNLKKQQSTIWNKLLLAAIESISDTK